MITHLFFHQEKVEEQCAINSWLSVRDCVEKDDEVVILDLGNTLKSVLPFSIAPKYVRIEKIRTDIPQERSYTFGLNMMMPQARYEWIFLWRSDYVYHQRYLAEIRSGIHTGNVVLPYEAFFGARNCNAKWCKKNLGWLRNGDEESLLKHSHVWPAYETMDIPHFAIKKQLWMQTGGMDNRLWGWGYQFPEFFLRLKRLEEYNPVVKFDMIAFHQAHFGSFGQGLLTEEQAEESRASELKLLQVAGGTDGLEQLKSQMRQSPLRPRRPENAYRPKGRKRNQGWREIGRRLLHIVKNSKNVISQKILVRTR